MTVRANGFTLVEMVVALTIFALVATAGVGLLRASADTQVAVDRTLDEQGRLERIALLLQADLGQVVIRPTTRSDGGVRPAFRGTETSMTFVRDGIVPSRPEPAPSINRVEWRLSEGRLERTAHRAPDGLQLLDPPARLAELGSVRFAYRDEAGGWNASWPRDGGPALPRAVRMEIAGEGTPATQFIVALPDINPVPGEEPVS